ncbi:unnamed protein product [Amoebophrya sp. A25]|nr:unnamed protein product [Amoebophrya sp. A25]|eukprot:GSA25T00021273001.1
MLRSQGHKAGGAVFTSYRVNVALPHLRVGEDCKSELASMATAPSLTDAQPNPTAAAKTICFIDDLETAKTVLQNLQEDNMPLAVDVEGEKLCRNGQICLIQVCNDLSPVYLFDVCALGRPLFHECGLKRILEDPTLLKVLFDGRADNDALYHQFGVDAKCLYDIQVLFSLKFGKEKHLFLVGLSRCLRQYKGLTPSQQARITRLKEVGTALHENVGEWGKRPLNALLLEYAANDARHLLGMRSMWGDDVVNEKVMTITASRVSKAVHGESTPRGKHMTERDFVL